MTERNARATTKTKGKNKSRSFALLRMTNIFGQRTLMTNFIVFSSAGGVGMGAGLTLATVSGYAKKWA
jgi:hypothetical protein